MKILDIIIMEFTSQYNIFYILLERYKYQGCHFRHRKSQPQLSVKLCKTAHIFHRFLG